MQKRCRQVFEFYVQLVLPSQLRFSRFQHVRKQRSLQTGVISVWGKKIIVAPSSLAHWRATSSFLWPWTNRLWTGSETKQHLTIAYLSASVTAGLKLTQPRHTTCDPYSIKMHKVKNKWPQMSNWPAPWSLSIVDPPVARCRCIRCCANASMPSQEPLANHSLQEGVVLSRHWQFGPYQSTHIYPHLPTISWQSEKALSWQTLWGHVSWVNVMILLSIYPVVI